MRKAGANVRKELSLQPSIYSSTTRSLHLLLLLFHHQIPPSLPALESSKERILGRETRLLHWLLHNAETDTGLHVELAALYIAKINGDCQRFGFRIDPPSNLFLKPPSLPGSLNMCGWFFFCIKISSNRVVVSVEGVPVILVCVIDFLGGYLLSSEWMDGWGESTLWVAN